MERLTKKSRDGSHFVYDTYISLNEPHKSVANKLGQIEDIMEKYDIESVEELEKVLSNHEEYQSALNVIKDKGSCGFCEHLDNERIKILEKALELKIINDAISEGLTLTDKEVKESKKFFIEQAKKELGEK